MVASVGRTSPADEFITIPIGVWGGIAFVVALGALTANWGVTAASVLVVPLFVRLLWRRGEPPILLFLVMFQWLQVAARVFHAAVMGVPVSELAVDPGAPVTTAILLGLAALVTLALGLRVGTALTPARKQSVSLPVRSRLSAARVFVAYIVLMVAGQALIRIGWNFPAWRQWLLGLASLKWVALFALGYIAFGSKQGRWSLLVASGIEIVLGLQGYFSDFKTVLFVLIIAALFAGVRLTWRRMALAAVPAGLALLMLLVWTGIRDNYRAYLNQGTGRQVILVGWSDQMQYLFAHIGAFTSRDFVRASEIATERLAYVDNFARVLAYVPAVRPHTGGELWLGAVRHILTPRAFFPEKPNLPSDSELTMRFTGWQLASTAEGTSISLGYVAESYIDFGMMGMWLPIFLLGLLWGGMYAQFVRASPRPVFGYGFAVAGLLPTAHYETAAVKQLGGTVSQFLILILVLRFLLPRLLCWLGEESGGVPVPWSPGLRTRS